jgi:hypothetical protein
VILVGRAPALSQLRGWTPAGLTHITDSLPALPALPALPGHGGRTRRHADKHRRPEGAGPVGDPGRSVRRSGHAPAEPGRATADEQADSP